MTKRIRHIKGNASRDGFENDLIASNDDSALFETISEYMKGRLDIEDVRNDPGLKAAKTAVKDMVSDYRNNTQNKENRKYIKDIFSSNDDEILSDEINYIKQEIDEKNLNQITSEWVKEWHEKKQKTGTTDPKTEEIRNFVTGSINSSSAGPQIIPADRRKKRYLAVRFARYISLSAAAVIAVFLLIRTLAPSSDAENIFNTYYKPFNAVSPVTRSINNSESDIYSSAIESYRTGDYESAAAAFSNSLQNYPSATSSEFFLGLSQIALGNYDQAINLLEGVINDSGEYEKEAQWYLGLSYLKTGNKQKASGCFEYLAKSNGFYREGSERILRRLK